MKNSDDNSEEGFVWDWENESIPLETAGNGRPKFVGPVDKHSANEGENVFITFQVEGDPPPQMSFFKGFKDLAMEPRFRMWTRGGTGESNIVILGINQCRQEEEAEYKCVLKNEHGEEEFDFKFFVTVEGGMDFRAMLMKRKKPKKKTPPPAVEWLEKLVDVNIQQGKSDMVMFTARLSEKGKKGHWFLRNEKTRKDKRATEDGLEITKKDAANFEIGQEGDCYSLTIFHPKLDNTGRYTLLVKLDKESKFTSGYLEVTDADPEFCFAKKLACSGGEEKGFTNRPVTLKCVVNQDNAKVKWLKDGICISLASGRYERIDGMTKFSLTILACSLDDTGLYSCELQEFVKPGEDAETCCLLVVEEYPHTFTSQLKGQNVVENDECAFEIDVEAEDAEVTWYHNGKLISADDSRVTIIIKGKKRKLLIKCAQLQDAGQITVKTNTQESSSSLRVTCENYIVTGLPASLEVIERGSAQFPIELKDPEAVVELLLNGEPIVDNKRIKIVALGGGHHMVIVNNWTMADDGILEVQTPSNRGDAVLVSKCKVNITKGEEVPEFGNTGPVTGVANDHCNWSIPYSVEGQQESLLEVVVVKDGKELVIGKDVNLTMDDNKIDLSVIDPIRGKSGVYTVILRNAQGEVRKDINVNIMDKPTPPRNVTVTDVFYDNCIVHWQPPIDDGGTEIMRYIIEAIDTSESCSEWAYAGETMTEIERDFKCHNLEHGHVYKFRLRAVNRLGKSEPCVMAGDGVLIKDPWDEPGVPGQPQTMDWGPNNCDLAWEAPCCDGGAPITAYVVEYLEKAGGGSWQHGATIRVEDVRSSGGLLNGQCPGLIEGCEYQFRIKAVNKGGPSKPSPPSQPPIIAMNRFIEPFVQQPGMYDIVVKRGRPFRFDIWYGGEPPPSVTWLKDGEVLTGGGDGDHFSTEVFSRNSVYCERNAILTVSKSERARDKGTYVIHLKSQTGVHEASGSVNVLDVPGCPRVFGVSQVYPDKVAFGWQPPEDDGGQPIKYYQIRMMDFDTGDWHIVAESTDVQATVTGLKPGKCYEFEIVAVNKEGESLATKIGDPVFTSEPYRRPSPPITPCVADYNSNSVLLKWSKPHDDGGMSITRYVIQKSNYGGVVPKDAWTDAISAAVLDCEQVDEMQFQVSVAKLVKGKTYEFRVFAENKIGLSEPSPGSDPHLCRSKNARPSIDKGLGGSRITRENRRVEWRIPIVGHPQPRVVWTKSEEHVECHICCHVDQQEDDDDEGVIACFSIPKCKKSDAGTYEIFAKNDLGSDSLAIDLIVLDCLEECDCSLFKKGDLDCPCKHKPLFNVKQTLRQEFGLILVGDMLYPEQQLL